MRFIEWMLIGIWTLALAMMVGSMVGCVAEKTATPDVIDLTASPAPVSTPTPSPTAEGAAPTPTAMPALDCDADVHIWTEAELTAMGIL